MVEPTRQQQYNLDRAQCGILGFTLEDMADAYPDWQELEKGYSPVTSEEARALGQYLRNVKEARQRQEGRG